MYLFTSASGEPPTYVPDGQPNYPVFDVSLQSPLPPFDSFIGTLYGFVSPPLVGIVAAFLGIAITKAIMNAFNKK